VCAHVCYALTEVMLNRGAELPQALALLQPECLVGCWRWEKVGAES
jgi:hypothetical protein